MSLRKKRPLLTPDIAVTSVGSEIVYGGGESTVSDVVWTARLDYKWNRDIVVEETLKFPKLEPQVCIVCLEDLASLDFFVLFCIVVLSSCMACFLGFSIKILLLSLSLLNYQIVLFLLYWCMWV